MIRPPHIPALLIASLIPTAAMAPAAIYTFQTIDAPGSTLTLAYDVNDFGTVAGFFQDATGEHGYTLTAGGFSVIDFPGALFITQALGINNAGQVAGSFQAQAGGNQGFLDDSAEPAPIRDVNNLGQTVGPATAISYPGAAMTFAEGLNDTGQIVGGYALGGVQHGFLESGGTFTSIDVPGALYTIAFGINNADQIVGNYVGSDPADPYHHGFVYQDGVFQTVDFPGARESEIFGINRDGDIVGMYRDASGEHGFLALDPPGPASVPEPASGLLLLTGLLALPFCRSRLRI